MNKGLKHTISIGEFAKISGVSKQTLIFYEKEGILTASYRDEKNYRYYALEQLEKIDRIVALREIGVSISEIRGYEEKKTPQNYIDMLESEEDRIESEIQKLKTMKAKIRDKIEATKKGIILKDKTDPHIEEQEAEYLLTYSLEDEGKAGCKEEMPAFKGLGDDLITDRIVEFIKYIRQKDIKSGYSIGGIIDGKCLAEKRFDRLSHLFIRTKKKIRVKNFREKAKGTYATIIHRGPYCKTCEAYDRLFQFIDEKGLETVADSYEESLLDMFNVEEEDEYVTKISIMVENKREEEGENER